MHALADDSELTKALTHARDMAIMAAGRLERCLVMLSKTDPEPS
jgi:uncharacterized membrane protein